MVILPCNLRVVLLAHLVESPLPEVVDEGQDVRLSAQRQRVLFRPPAGVFEGIPEAAVDLEAVVDHGLDRDLVRRALHAYPARSRVEAARVLADDDVIDLPGPLVLEGRRYAGVELHRPEVDVLVEGEAELEEDAFLEYARLHVGVAYGAQVDGVERAHLVYRRVGQGLSRPLISLPPEVELLLVELESVLVAGRVEDLDALPHDLGPRPVPGNDSNLVALRHLLLLLFSRKFA